MHIDRIPVYRVYQRAIDLELYHAFAELVVQTSQDDTARRTYRQTRAMQIWQVETDVSGYFEPYHLRYPGEVLERFEEKLGNDVRVLRALALALGNTCAIQSDNMFVGNQRGAFLQKLRRSAGEDVYLQGALYLLETDAAQRHALLEKLAERECTRTEEALFILSLFDDRERGYEVMHTQLSHLFTQNRTLSLVYDFGVLEWFIRFYAEQAKKYRGKADLVLRTLMKLPYMNMKPDSREFSVLTKAGYRCDEIILANSLAVWADRLPDRLSSKGITAEKIATACGRMLLNAPKDLSEEFYEYLGWLFRFYNSFTVKYEGFQGLWEAVQYGLNPTAPKTLLWMNQTIQKDFPYRFDVFDPQYDDLAKELERDNYMELFTLQMLHSRQTIPLQQWLSRYQELTGADYGEYFGSRHTNSRRAFAFLVEKKEIDLWEFFEQHKDTQMFFPISLVMIGSWLIDRESTHDTLKNIMTIPVSMPDVLGAKLFWVGILTVLLGIYSVGVTLITGLAVGLSGLTAEVFFHGGTQIVLAGLTTYMVCMPLILIFGQIRGAYLGGSILAFFLGYSMMFFKGGILASIYPFSAALILVGFDMSEYAGTTTAPNPLLAVIGVGIMVLWAVLLLVMSSNKKEMKARKQTKAKGRGKRAVRRKGR